MIFFPDPACRTRGLLQVCRLINHAKTFAVLRREGAATVRAMCKRQVALRLCVILFAGYFFRHWVTPFLYAVIVRLGLHSNMLKGMHLMDQITILGLAAGTLTTIAFIPQLMKTWQTKSAKDVSFLMLIIFNSGIFLWLIYGIYLQALPIILANGITLVFNLIILWLKIKYR